MFALVLILLFVLSAKKNGDSRQARLAALRRQKVEAVLAARRAQARIDRLEGVKALPAEGQVQIVVNGVTVIASGPVRIVADGNTVCSVTEAPVLPVAVCETTPAETAYPVRETALREAAYPVREAASDSWFRVLN